ncbi:MAG TPA: PTS sugar transporter subunit IIB [Tissierellales bacterium]|nr:PTS sugar transporter subunit IIB [Tissierellales bacterium]
MKNIVFTRVDDRLIHGQVITAWSKVTSANRILVVDDEVASDPFMAKVLKIAAPSTVKVDVHGIEEAVKLLKGEDEGDKIMVLVKYPDTVLSLIDNGIQIKELNVGGMGAKPGRKSLYKNISVSQDEKLIFRKLIERNVNVFIQIVPDAKKIEIQKYL